MHAPAKVSSPPPTLDDASFLIWGLTGGLHVRCVAVTQQPENMNVMHSRAAAFPNIYHPVCSKWPTGGGAAAPAMNMFIGPPPGPACLSDGPLATMKFKLVPR